MGHFNSIDVEVKPDEAINLSIIQRMVVGGFEVYTRNAADEDRPTRIDMFDVATEVDKTLVAVAQAGRLLALDEPVKELCDSGPKRSTAVHQSLMQIAFQP